MIDLIKKNYKFIVFSIIVGIIAGIFMPSYYASMLTTDLMNEILVEIGSIDIFNIIVFVQTLGYAVFFSIIGIILSNKVGLWRKVEFNKKSFIIALSVGLIGGIIIILLDQFVFIPLCPQLYLNKLTLPYIIVSYTYGGIIEELMLRLGLMSFVSFLLWKLFTNSNTISNKVYVIANIICSFLFALGHIPATIVFFGGLTIVLIIRCFVLNGTLGFLFGHLYQKYGIMYAMIAHACAHAGMQIMILLLS